MAAKSGRQAHCSALFFDIVGYFRAVVRDSFLTHRFDLAQESIKPHLVARPFAATKFTSSAF